jgi:hypothetical protein
MSVIYRDNHRDYPSHPPSMVHHSRGTHASPADDATRCHDTLEFNDMLEFAIEYREALDVITGNQRMKLRQFELTEEDWKIAAHLRDVLKVRYYSLQFNY